MLTDFLAERKKLIFATHGESEDLPIGQLIDCVVDPDTGRIKAWWVQTFEGYRIMLQDDIRHWGKHRIVIRDENDLSSPDNLPRMKKFFQKEVSVIEAIAFVKKKKIGRIKNFTFDTNFSLILSLFLKGMWWFSSKRIISVRMVDKITKKGVFFCSNYATKIEKKDLNSDVSMPEVEVD